MRFKQLVCLVAVLLSFSGCSVGGTSQAKPTDLTQYREAYNEAEFQNYPCKYALLRFSESLPGGFSASSPDNSEYTFILTGHWNSDELQYNDHIYVRYQEVEQEGAEPLRYVIRLEQLYPQITVTWIKDTRNLSLDERLRTGPYFLGETSSGDVLIFQTGYGDSFKSQGIEYGDRIQVTYEECYTEDMPPEMPRLCAISITKAQY